MYVAPDSVAKYCDERVCLSVRSHISKTTCPNLTKFLYVLPVAVARSSFDDNAMFCTSGFVDDVMFAHNGLHGAWLG